MRLIITGTSPSPRKAQPPKGSPVTWGDIHNRIAGQRRKKRTLLQGDKVCSDHRFHLSRLNDILRAQAVRTMTVKQAARRVTMLTMRMLTKSQNFSVRCWRSPWSKRSTLWDWESGCHERRRRVKGSGVKLRRKPSKPRRRRMQTGREKDSS